MSDTVVGVWTIAAMLASVLFVVAVWDIFFRNRRTPEKTPQTLPNPATNSLTAMPKKDTMLGFRDRQLGWVFVAGGVALFLFVLSQEKFFDYRSGERFIAALASPVILYAIMRAFETGRRSKGEGE